MKVTNNAKLFFSFFQWIAFCFFLIFLIAATGNEKPRKVLFMRTVLQITAAQRIREGELFEKYVETIYNLKDVTEEEEEEKYISF